MRARTVNDLILYTGIGAFIVCIAAAVVLFLEVIS